MSSPHRFLPYIAPIRPGVRFAGRFVLGEIEGFTHIDLLFRDEKTNSEIKMGVYLASHSSGHRFTNDRIKLSLKLEGTADQRVDLLAEAVFGFVERNTADLSDDELLALFAPEPKKQLDPTPAGKRVDCRIGTACPNNCIFCSDRDPDESRQKPFASLLEKLTMLREQGYSHIMLTGFEPTLRSDIREIIKEAVRLGFDDIQCITNGVRVKDEAFLKSLLDAGLRTLILSIHSPDAETEDYLSGRVGSFREKAQVLAQAPKLFGDRATQTRTGLFFRTNSVLTKPGLPLVNDLIRWLDTAQSSLIPFVFPWIRARGEELIAPRFREILPGYDAVRETFQPHLSRLQDRLDPLSLVNLPPCVIPDLSHARQLSKAVLVGNRAQEQAGETPEMDLQRCLMDPDMVYLPVCDGCRIRGECRGVARGYVAEHNDKGLAKLAT